MRIPGGLGLRGRAAPPAVALILATGLFIVGSILISGFGSAFSIRSILVLSAFLGIAATGQTIVILLGGIDLSIPFIIGLANVVAAEMSGGNYPIWVILIVVIGLSAGIGSINGLIAARLHVHPLIVTLGVGNAVLGAVLLWTAGFPSGSTPPSLADFVSITSTTGPVPVPPLVLFWVLLSGGLVFALTRTVYGRQLYALGANAEAARLALVRPVRIWGATFALSGAFSGVAGILLLGFTGTAFGDVGAPYLFLSIAAVVIGGTSLLGGAGGYGGTFFGAIILTELTTILVGFGLTAAAEQGVLGFVLLVLVSLYGREPSIRSRV